jgi:hypothetical protein
MESTEACTLTSFSAPSVLAIACPPDLVARCAKALEGIGITLRTCDVLNAATAVAERRPLALVLVEELYAFNPAEFDALARDVQASLVRVEPRILVPKLELLLGSAIDAAASRRGELLPAWPDVDEGRQAIAPPPSPETPAVLEVDDREGERSTEPNMGLFAYRVGQRVPSRAGLSMAWPVRSDAPPSSRPGT